MRQWLERLWYEPGGGAALMPLAMLYRAAQSMRAGAYRTGLAKAVRIDRPVVVVGNLSVGGTGKTPLVAWLVEALAGRGVRAGIVSRGYGRTQDAVRVVEAADSWQQVGDEPLLLARRTGVPVVVGRDRVAAARRLAALGVSVIVADDGLQHLRLARDCELIVVDANRGFGNGRLLPAGPLREPLNRLRTADGLVMNASGAPAVPEHLAGGPDVQATMHLEMEGVLPVEGLRHGAPGEGRAGLESLEAYVGRAVHAVAGIGNPARFFSMLRAQGLTITAHAFPDHHAFAPRDLDFGDAAPVLMTEKDAVKCSGFGDARLRYVRVRARLEEPGASQLLARVLLRMGRD